MNSYLKQATASQARAIGPFLDDTDFKTAETGLTIANTDIKLVINGAASANKNSGGGTHRINGVYGVTFDATDTATVGEIYVSVVVSGALPVFHSFIVVEEAVYDELFGASALGYVDGATVNATKVGGTSQSTGDLSALITAVDDFVDTEVAAIKTQTDKLTFTVANQLDVNVLDWKSATAPAMTGDAYARLGAPAGASISADIAAAKVDTAAIKVATDKLTFTVANQIDANVLDWKSATAPAMTGDAFARLGAPAGASVSADVAAVKVDTAAVKAKTDNLPTDPADASDVAALITAVDDFVDTEVAAIKAKTDLIPASPAAIGSAMTLTTGERTSIADALLDRDMATGTDSGSTTVRTVRQALRFLRNLWTISGGTLSVYKEDDSTQSWTATVTQTAGNPVSSIDPP